MNNRQLLLLLGLDLVIVLLKTETHQRTAVNVGLQFWPV